MSFADGQRDKVFRDALGWPVPAKPTTPVAIVADLKAFLVERRGRLERRRAEVSW